MFTDCCQRSLRISVLSTSFMIIFYPLRRLLALVLRHISYHGSTYKRYRILNLAQITWKLIKMCCKPQLILSQYLKSIIWLTWAWAGREWLIQNGTIGEKRGDNRCIHSPIYCILCKPHLLFVKAEWHLYYSWTSSAFLFLRITALSQSGRPH